MADSRTSVSWSRRRYTTPIADQYPRSAPSTPSSRPSHRRRRSRPCSVRFSSLTAPSSVLSRRLESLRDVVGVAVLSYDGALVRTGGSALPLFPLGWAISRERCAIPTEKTPLLPIAVIGSSSARVGDDRCRRRDSLVRSRHGLASRFAPSRRPTRTIGEHRVPEATDVLRRVPATKSGSDFRRGHNTTHE